MDDRLVYCEGFSTPGVVASAVFSADRVYRYELTRTWDHHKPLVNFIGLNPSTATPIPYNAAAKAAPAWSHTDAA